MKKKLLPIKENPKIRYNSSVNICLACLVDLVLSLIDCIIGGKKVSKVFIFPMMIKQRQGICWSMRDEKLRTSEPCHEIMALVFKCTCAAIQWG